MDVQRPRPFHNILSHPKRQRHTEWKYDKPRNVAYGSSVLGLWFLLVIFLLMMSIDLSVLIPLNSKVFGGRAMVHLRFLFSSNHCFHSSMENLQSGE